VDKRIRRRIVRKAQVGALSVAVLAGSIGGFAALARVWTGHERNTADAGPTAAPTQVADPTTTESVPAGTDIGLNFELCDVRVLKHVDFLGDETDETAWTGAPVTEAGRCSNQTDDRYVVAVDFTGDALADDVWRALEHCFLCEPYAATDLDGDGDDELIVLESGGTTPRFDLFDLDPMDEQARIRPVTVAPPGDAAAGFPAGDAAHIVTGGDEGFTGFVSCEGYPDDPRIVVAWADGPVDGPGADWRDTHVARLILEDGVVRVVQSSNDRARTDADLVYPFGVDDAACGVDWNPSTAL
jgi:hypothetical protein